MKHGSLQALVAAIEEGSLRAAAQRLSVSQPAITKVIQELEKDVGAALLVRASVGVTPTPQGQRLYEHAVKVLRELSMARDEIAQMSGRMRGDLAIGAVPVAVMLLLPEAMRTFCKEFPDIQIRLREELYLEQLEHLRRGDVQVAVGGIPKGLPAGEFVTEPLIETRMVVVANRQHRHRNARSLTELAELPWVYTGTSRDEGYARMLFESHGLQAPRRGAVVNSTLALMSLVAHGEFMGLMPEQIAQAALAREFFTIVPVRETELALSVGAMVRKDAVVSPAVRHFIKHLHRAAHHVKRHGDNQN